MKDKVRQSLRNLLDEVADHESETEFSAVSVDLGDLKRVLRWAQNSSYVWFVGDRVKRTGVRVPLDWMTPDMVGTVVETGEDDGTAYVDWDGAPEYNRRVRMFHNEIKRIK